MHIWLQSHMDRPTVRQCKTLPPLDTVPEDFYNRLETRGLHFSAWTVKTIRSLKRDCSMVLLKASVYANSWKTIFHFLKIFGGMGTTPLAKRCVLEQKLLLTAYRKSHVRNRLVPKW